MAAFGHLEGLLGVGPREGHGAVAAALVDLDAGALDHKSQVLPLTGTREGLFSLIQAVIDGMVERGFGRIVNITSLSVYMPIEGLDLSSGARAGLTAFLAGVSRTVADRNVTINNILPGKMDTDRLRGGIGRGVLLPVRARGHRERPRFRRRCR